MNFGEDAILNLIRTPFTHKHPFEEKKVFGRYRGCIMYHPKKCIGCRQCEKNCPVGAVKFHKKGEIDFDMGLCILCGQCGDVCPTQAIEYINHFENASKDKKSFKAKESK